MATRTKKRRTRRELPPPLPPGTRTIGQLVAETIRFYGKHFWRSLVLGVGPAAVVIGWILLASASFVGACVLVAAERPPRAVLLDALAAACLVAVPILLGF